MGSRSSEPPFMASSEANLPMSSSFKIPLLLTPLCLLLQAGCQTTPKQTEARLERQLHRLERELEAVGSSSDLTSARGQERLLRLQAEFQRTLTALTQHLETMAAESEREAAKAAPKDAKR